MIGRQGTIFHSHPARKTLKKKVAVEDLDGDSGVGQAPEFPFKSLKKTPRKAESPQAEGPLRQAQGKPHFFYTSRLLSKFGTVLIVFSILGFLLTYGPIIKVELGYRFSKIFDKQVAEKGSFAQLLSQTITGESEGVPDPNFSLIIPKIHAKGKVIPNVDSTNESEYFSALKTGIAHAKGTYFPGGSGNIYLFAHSTDSPLNIVRYNAVFYLLRELDPGDEVVVYFSGVKHRYKVIDKKIVEPTDVAYLSAQNPESKEQLILQTCWPPGTTLKRLLIFAHKSV